MPAKKIIDKRLKIKDLKPKAASSAMKKTIKPVTKTVGLNVPVYGLTGAKKGTTMLPKSVFGAKVNVELMAQAVRVYQINQRQGTATTKSRGEINKTKAKWYRQKGTGRARHGAKSAPIFVGGGVAFGPRQRNFELKLSKQMRKKSLASALSQRYLEDRVKIVDVAGSTGKTSEIYKMFKNLNVIDEKGGQLLFVPEVLEAKRAAKNIDGVEIYPATSINTYIVLNSRNLIISQDALVDLAKLFEEKN